MVNWLAVNGADERLDVDLNGSSKVCFKEYQYYTDFPERLRNKSIMSNSESNLNFEIFHEEFYYCKSNNFVPEEKRESIRL